MIHLGKKLLSLLTVFCLTLSLVPTVALAATPSKIVIGTTGNSGITLDENTPYLVNKSSNATSTRPSENTGYMYFDASTGVLELHKYNDQGISWTRGIYANSGDLTIKLIGTNYIKSGNNGINVSDNLIIEGTGSIELTKAENTTIYAAGNITVQGAANVKAIGGKSGQAIHTVGGTLTITGSGTKVEVTKGYGGAIKTGGNGNGTINLNDGAQLIAPSITDVKGDLKINNKNATDEEKTKISNGIIASPSAPTYTVSGAVTDGKNPIQGATVQLCTADTVGTSAPTVISTSTTDTNGTYTLPNVPVGNYTIKVSKDGYNDYTESLDISSNVINKNLTLTATAPSQYTVTINAPDTMTPNGSTSQTVKIGQEMTAMTYMAGSDYYFPESYSVAPVNGVHVARDGYTQIVVSGTPTANTTITLPSPTEKGSQKALSLSNFTAYDCTNSNNNDGYIDVNTTGVGNPNSKIEYQKKNDTAGSNWKQVNIGGAAAKIQNLTPGTYLIRYPATDTQKASTSWEVTILAYTPYGLWVRGIPVTEENKSNILGDGTVNYNLETATLTLNNATINNTASSTVALTTPRSYVELAGIATTGDLKIEVTGDSTISSTNGNAIYGKNSTDMAKKLTITGSASLGLKSYGTMSAISLDRDKAHDLTINENVTIHATVEPKNPESITSDDNGLVFSATSIEIDGNATVSAINNGKNLAIYCPGELIVKDSATLTAQSNINNYAISVNNFTYPNHSIKASTNYDGSNSDTTYDAGKLKTAYKYVKVEPIRVTGVTLSKSSLSMKTNQTETLTATVKPSDAAVQSMTWTSSDTSVATVNATGATCVVTAVAPGTAKITVTTIDGGYTAECTVTVIAPTPAAITLDHTGTVTFPSAKVGYGDQEYKTVTVTNTGDIVTGPLTIALSGNHADKFECAPDSISSIAGGGIATFQVRPKTGSPVGAYTATVTVKSGSLSQSFDVSFTVETASKPSSGGGSSTTYYPVNIPADSEGGSVAVSPKSASRGSTVAVTVTPASGYQVDQVQAVDKDGNKLTLTEKGEGKYTFVMPSGKVDVSVAFSKVQQDSPYSDVSKDSYYYDAVQWASDKGITNGVSEGLFAPDWVCTRGQIVTFLWRSVGSPAPKTAEMPFVDVAQNAYYAQAVLWAVENGITKGTSEATFSPEQTCTRAHAVTFLYRLAGTPAVTGSSFQDVDADAYYSAAWAVQKGITNGTSETTFSPDQTCTRAQIVTFLYRMDQAN